MRVDTARWFHRGLRMLACRCRGRSRSSSSPDGGSVVEMRPGTAWGIAERRRPHHAGPTGLAGANTMVTGGGTPMIGSVGGERAFVEG